MTYFAAKWEECRYGSVTEIKNVGYCCHRHLTSSKNKKRLIVKGHFWHDSYLTFGSSVIGCFPLGDGAKLNLALERSWAVGSVWSGQEASNLI